MSHQAELRVRVSYSKQRGMQITHHIEPGARLVPGVYEALLLVDVRDATLGEVAEEAYKTTVDFQQVAERVIEAHEARKAGAKP